MDRRFLILCLKDVNYIVAELRIRDDTSIEIKLGKALRYGMKTPNGGPADVNKKSRVVCMYGRRVEMKAFNSFLCETVYCS